MATIKSYTDLYQSKKLAKILPLKSADMYYHKNAKGEIVEYPHFNAEYKSMVDRDINYNDDVLPCWSLTTLVSILPKGTNISTPDHLNKIRYSCWNDYDITYSNNPIDACVEMILKLHKLDVL